MPAVDCAVTYSFVPANVPVLGFALGFIGELVGIGLLLVFKAPILLLPAFIPLFFDNATLACFANRYGGRRAAVILPLLNGLFQVAVSELMLLFFQNNGFNLQAWGAFFDNNSLTWCQGHRSGSLDADPECCLTRCCTVILQEEPGTLLGSRRRIRRLIQELEEKRLCLKF